MGMDDLGTAWVMRLPPLGAGDASPRCTRCGYTSDVATPFCPWCGRAATPEGMRILRERWEALNDGD